MIEVESAVIREGCDSYPTLDVSFSATTAVELSELGRIIVNKKYGLLAHDIPLYPLCEQLVVRTPAAKKIIFSGPATIILWSDGTKTVVKCDERDTFDPEKGVALCYMKKMCGNFEKMERQLKKARKEYAKKHE